MVDECVEREREIERDTVHLFDKESAKHCDTALRQDGCIMGCRHMVQSWLAVCMP